MVEISSIPDDRLPQTIVVVAVITGTRTLAAAVARETVPTMR